MFLKLTDYGLPVGFTWVNMALVHTMYAEHNADGPATRLCYHSGYITVTETPEEIEHALHQMRNDGIPF